MWINSTYPNHSVKNDTLKSKDTYWYWCIQKTLIFFSNYYFISEKKYHIYIEKIPAVEWQRQQGKHPIQPINWQNTLYIGVSDRYKGLLPESPVWSPHEEDVYSIGCTSSFYFANMPDMAFYRIHVLSTALVLTIKQEEPRWAQVEENACRDDEPGGSWLKPVSKTTAVWLSPFRELARHC